ALFAHVFLSYPTGRLGSRVERGFVAAVYVFELAFALLFLLYYDGGAFYVSGLRVPCPQCGTAPLTSIGRRDLTGAGHVRVGIGLIALCAALLVAKLRRTEPGPRRVLLPLGLAALVLAAQGALAFGLDLAGGSTNFWTSPAVYWSETFAVVAIPLALAAGVL